MRHKGGRAAGRAFIENVSLPLIWPMLVMLKRWLFIPVAQHIHI